MIQMLPAQVPNTAPQKIANGRMTSNKKKGANAACCIHLLGIVEVRFNPTPMIGYTSLRPK